MRTRFGQSSIRKIISLLLCITVLLLVFLNGTLLLSVRQNRETVDRYIAETTRLFTGQLGDETDAIGTEVLNLLNPDARIRALPDVFDSRDTGAIRTLKEISEQLRVLEIRYRLVSGCYGYVRGADALVKSNGTAFSYSIRSGLERTIMDHLRESMAEQQNTLRRDYIRDGGKTYLMIWYARDDRAAACLIPLERIFEELRARAEGFEIWPSITTPEGVRLSPEGEGALAAEAAAAEAVRPDGIFHYGIRSVGTLSIYVLPGRGMLQTAYRWQWILTVFIAVCLAAAGVMVIVYFRHILVPLQAFVHSLDDLDTDKYLEETSSNHLLELESANEQFRSLVRKIQALKITLYEKELNEQRIELEFAHEQIRPHFFLNCISLIHGIADARGEGDIVAISADLSDYLRYLFQGSKVLRTVRQEADHVMAYVRIQQLRYGKEAFQFDCMIDEGLEEAEIPVLLLQTLVENAFSHGLARERKGEISLYITREGGSGGEMLYLCVSDNGGGFSPETIRKIENNEEILYNGRKHVGLQNTAKRLRLIYGDRAKMKLSNLEEGFGAIAEVWIPLEGAAQREHSASGMERISCSEGT